ncbi:hypothetical protein ABH937_006236, partial [Kitasatospora sp. GAS1066B]
MAPLDRTNPTVPATFLPGGGPRPRAAAHGRDVPASEAPATTAPVPAPEAGTPISSPVDAPVLRLAEAPLPPAEIDRLVGGAHHDPHALLGAHPTTGGTAIRVLRPLAERVTIETAYGPAELTHQQGGLFTGLLPGSAIPAYQLKVRYPGGEPLAQQDGYRFAPTLGELDLHLIREGRHEQLWKALGSHPRTVDGVLGTAFAVWAPNAVGVRLVGDFNHWDGTGFPMRSLGASGIWELFVPGLGVGTRYKYEIRARDGRLLQKADPLARAAQCPPETASVVHRSEYRWGDGQWLERRARAHHHRAPMSIYELHLASWRPGLTYRQLAVELPGYLRELNFTHVEFMPV